MSKIINDVLGSFLALLKLITSALMLLIAAKFRDVRPTLLTCQADDPCTSKMLIICGSRFHIAATANGVFPFISAVDTAL